MKRPRAPGAQAARPQAPGGLKTSARATVASLLDIASPLDALRPFVYARPRHCPGPIACQSTFRRSRYTPASAHSYEAICVRFINVAMSRICSASLRPGCRTYR